MPPIHNLLPHEEGQTPAFPHPKSLQIRRTLFSMQAAHGSPPPAIFQISAVYNVLPGVFRAVPSPSQSSLLQENLLSQASHYTFPCRAPQDCVPHPPKAPYFLFSQSKKIYADTHSGQIHSCNHKSRHLQKGRRPTPFQTDKPDVFRHISQSYPGSFYAHELTCRKPPHSLGYNALSHAHTHPDCRKPCPLHTFFPLQ